MSSSPVAITGAHGFLGWHLRAALLEDGVPATPVSVGDAFDLESAKYAINGARRLIHLAGVNRASDDAVADGNILFAQQIAAALRGAEAPPPVVVYANSIQAENGTVYGEAKARAAEILRVAAEAVGSAFVDVRLPNLFGEHGRAHYNSVVATFCEAVANGGTPVIEHDRDMTLLHAQDAADVLSGRVDLEAMPELTVVRTVSEVLKSLASFGETYRRGEIPGISAPFDRNLFNTYRSFTFPDQAPIGLTRHVDARGSFFEILRSHGGDGQSSFSTTEQGITRGDHFHRRKVERFTVLSGEAVISLRRVLTPDVIRFSVNGETPVAIDMPTMWSHKITNIGSTVLYTSFWTNDIFDPNHPDTIAEAVDS